MPSRAPLPGVSRFQRELIGCWKNLPFGRDCHGMVVGGEENPLSYNIMPLPEATDADGYILKNFRYHERLHVNDDKDKATLAISACAPNRGGQITQIPHAIFYEQQVRFAEGPAKGSVVHVENGTWLWLPRFVQRPGPYLDGPDTPVIPSLQQPNEIFIAKQIAIPHGNTVLALGHVDSAPNCDCVKEPHTSQVLEGKPLIPDGESPFPHPEEPEPIMPGTPPSSGLNDALNANDRYSTKMSMPSDFQNPIPEYTLCPNLPVQEAVKIIDPDHYMHWHVTTLQLAHGKGEVIDIPFELRVADVKHYIADYWLLFKGCEKYLAYTQTILMRLRIKGRHYIFPHVTCNTLTYCPDACARPAPCTIEAEEHPCHKDPCRQDPCEKDPCEKGHDPKQHEQKHAEPKPAHEEHGGKKKQHKGGD